MRAVLTDPRLQVVRDLVDAIYKTPQGGVGCCLHILVDDGNLEDTHVDYCLENLEPGHDLCRRTALAFRSLSLKQRALVQGQGWCPTCQRYSCCGICHDCGGELRPAEEGPDEPVKETPC